MAKRTISGQEQINDMVVTITGYIDQYPEETLTSKQVEIIIKTRKIIIDSLKESSTEPSDKRIKKIARKLDKSFHQVISIFAKDGIQSPEIYETIYSKEIKKDNSPKNSRESNKKRISSKSKKESRDISSENDSIISEYPELDAEKAFVLLMARRLDLVIKDNEKLEKNISMAAKAIAELVSRNKELTIRIDKLEE